MVWAGKGVQYRVWEISLSWYGWLHGYIHIKKSASCQLKTDASDCVLFMLQLKYVKIQPKWHLTAVRLLALQALFIFSYMKLETQNFPRFSH